MDLVSILEQITVARGMEYAGLVNLSHMLYSHIWG